MSKRATKVSVNNPANFHKQAGKSFKNMNYLKRARIVVRNLVCVVGLSEEVASRDLLLRNEYFGQYGKVCKLALNKEQSYLPKAKNGPVFSCLVTFEQEHEAALAILSLDGARLGKRKLKANFGSTKFCQSFIRNARCGKKECSYFHNVPMSESVLDKDALENPEVRRRQLKLAEKLANLRDRSVSNKLLRKNKKTIFPSPYHLVESLADSTSAKVVERDFSDFRYKKVVAETVHNTSRHNSSHSTDSSISEDKLYQPKANSRFARILELSDGAATVDVPTVVQQSLAFILARQSTFKQSSEDILFRSMSVSKSSCYGDWFRYNACSQ